MIREKSGFKIARKKIKQSSIVRLNNCKNRTLKKSQVLNLMMSLARSPHKIQQNSTIVEKPRNWLT